MTRIQARELKSIQAGYGTVRELERGYGAGRKIKRSINITVEGSKIIQVSPGIVIEFKSSKNEVMKLKIVQA